MSCNVNEPKQCISTWQTTEVSAFTKQQIDSFKTKANCQQTEVTGPLSRRSWGGTRDKPKNVCVGGYRSSRSCQFVI